MPGWLRSWAVFQLFLIARSWSEVQDSKLSHHHSARLACNMPSRDLNHRRTGWNDAHSTPPPHPRIFNDGQKLARAALTFFSNLWVITVQLLVKGWLGQVRQRSYDSTSSRGHVWCPSCELDVLFRQGHRLTLTAFKSRQDLQNKAVRADPGTNQFQ